MIWHLVLCIVLLVVYGKAISSPGSLTREAGEDVVFMYNGTAMSEATWGVRDGNTNELSPRLYRVFNPGGAFPDTQINSTRYAGRVSFVGNLTQGQAWFKITNLNINDTNQYLVKIILLKESSYRPSATSLTVKEIIPATTTFISSPGSTLISSTTQSMIVTTTNPSTLTNLTTTLTVNGASYMFSEEMKNASSFSFKDFSIKFEDAIRLAYKDEENFKSVEVVTLRKGSINVTFVVFFKKEMKYDQACAPLEKAIENGKLGSFKIVPGSLGCSKASPPSPPSPGTGVHPGIIAGVAVVGVLAIAGLIIAVLFVCRKKSPRKDYRSSMGGQGVRYEIDARYRGPEEQYASVQRPAASGAKQSNDQRLPQYAAVDKSKKTKKKTRDPDELVYADLDHNASMDTRPPSVPRPVSGSGTVYADIQSGRQKPQYPPPQYGNILEISHA